ncbi:MAG: hypothetical protein ABJ382_23390, partial [Ilumatobacter sp.]
VVTDSNRDRAHQWRSSQDVTGFTESADDESDVLRFESGDQRLPLFDVVTADQQTVSIQDGPVTVEASSYGERFAYLPENRPVMAVDGDPDTAWIVADRAPAVGEFIRLDIAEPITHLDLLQPPAGPDERTITRVGVEVDGSPPVFFDLDERSRTGTGQRIDIEATAEVTITITGTTAPQPPIGEAIGGVGFVEIGTGLAPTTEIIRTPIDAMGRLANAAGVDVVLTRLRHEPTDRWRSDPEPRLAREFELPNTVTVDPTVTLRLDRRLDDALLAELLGESAAASAHLTGAPNHRGAAAFDGDDASTWITPFDDVIGQSVTYSGAGTATNMTIGVPDDDGFSPITTVRVTDDEGSFDIAVPPGPDAQVELPREVDLTRVTLEIVAIDERITPNRRFNEPTVLPAAISEIRFDGVSPTVGSSERLTAECRDDLLTLDGDPIAVSFDVATADALAGDPIGATVCGDAIDLPAGSHRVLSTSGSTTGFHVDRVTLSTASVDSAGAVDPTRPIVVESSARSASLDVPACPTGCWVIHGEGYNDAWTATADGQRLGPPRLIDGNANGWWLSPTESTTRVEIRWPVQRQLNIAFLLTVLAVMACVASIAWPRRATGEPDPAAPAVAAPRDRTWALGVAATVSGAVL